MSLERNRAGTSDRPVRLAPARPPLAQPGLSAGQDQRHLVWYPVSMTVQRRSDP